MLSATTWFVADGRTLYSTSDGGSSWTSVSSSLALAGSGTGILDFVSGPDGTFWHTVDGGRT